MHYIFDWDGKNSPVITEKFDIEWRHESKLLANFDYLDNQNSKAMITIILYLNEISCKSFKILIETMLEEIKSKIIQTYEIEDRH